MALNDWLKILHRPWRAPRPVLRTGLFPVDEAALVANVLQKLLGALETAPPVEESG
jgi:hypothetical protein